MPENLTRTYIRLWFRNGTTIDSSMTDGTFKVRDGVAKWETLNEWNDGVLWYDRGDLIAITLRDPPPDAAPVAKEAADA